MTGYFLMSGGTGVVLIKIGTTQTTVLGVVFITLCTLMGWQLISHPRWQINLETGQLRLIRNIRLPMYSTLEKSLSIQEYTRLHLRMRMGPSGTWTVVMSDIHGKELAVAPCVSREHGEGIARLLSEKFGLKNDEYLG